MMVIAAVVVGGTRITGGHGTMIGTVLGVLLIAIVQNNLIMLGIPTHYQTFVVGLADGYWGYLPTPAQHELGGYETWLSTNNVELKASEKIVSELLKQFSLIKTK